MARSREFVGQGRARLLSALLFIAALSMCTTACYEGWDNPPQGSGPQPPAPSPPPPTVKPLAYILFQPISMAADAIANDSCFPKKVIREFKANEWNLRLASIGKALPQIADQVVIKPVAIAAADCASLSAVQAASLDAAPWGTDPAPGADPAGRLAVHLKAAFWEEDPQASPPAPVTAADWAAWTSFVNAGRNVRSLHYFVISNPSQGYFFEWSAKEAAATVLNGTPIDKVDPTDAGASARGATVDADTAALIAWLAGQK